MGKRKTKEEFIKEANLKFFVSYNKDNKITPIKTIYYYKV